MTKIPKTALFGHIFKNSTSNFLCMVNSIGPRSVYTQFDFKNAFKKKEIEPQKCYTKCHNGKWLQTWTMEDGLFHGLT